MLTEELIVEIREGIEILQEDDPEMPDHVALAYAMFETLKEMDSGRDWYEFLERALTNVIDYTDMLDPKEPEIGKIIPVSKDMLQ